MVGRRSRRRHALGARSPAGRRPGRSRAAIRGAARLRDRRHPGPDGGGPAAHEPGAGEDRGRGAGRAGAAGARGAPDGGGRIRRPPSEPPLRHRHGPSAGRPRNPGDGAAEADAHPGAGLRGEASRRVGRGDGDRQPQPALRQRLQGLLAGRSAVGRPDRLRDRPDHGPHYAAGLLRPGIRRRHRHRDRRRRTGGGLPGRGGGTAVAGRTAVGAHGLHTASRRGGRDVPAGPVPRRVRPARSRGRAGRARSRFRNRPVSQPRGDRCCRSAAGSGRTHGRGRSPGPRPRCRPPGGGGARERALAAADRRRDGLPAGRAPAPPGRTGRRARTGHGPAQAGDQHGGVVAPAGAHRGRSRCRLGRDAHRLQVDPVGPLAAGRQPRPGAGLRGSARLCGGRGGQGQGRHRRGAGDGRTRRRPQARPTVLGRPSGRPSSPPRRARHRAALGPLRVGHRQPATDEDGHGGAARRSTDRVGGSRGDRGARPRRGGLAPAARGRCGAGALRDRGQGDCQTQRDRAEDEGLRRGGRGPGRRRRQRHAAALSPGRGPKEDRGAAGRGCPACGRSRAARTRPRSGRVRWHRDGRHRDGRHRDGRHRDGRHQDGRHQDGRHRDGRHGTP